MAVMDFYFQVSIKMVDRPALKTLVQKINSSHLKLLSFSYPSVLTYVLSAQQNCLRLNKMDLLSTHSICIRVVLSVLCFGPIKSPYTFI